MFGLCSHCDQFAWRVAERVSLCASLCAQSAAEAAAKLLSSPTAAQVTTTIHREALILYYCLSLRAASSETIVSRMRKVFHGWLRAEVVTNALLPIEGLSDGDPKFVKDAAVNKLGTLLDQREQAYGQGTDRKFETCAQILSSQLDIGNAPRGWVEALPVLLTRAWSAVSDEVNEAILSLRS